jgi:hypothetical protein
MGLMMMNYSYGSSVSWKNVSPDVGGAVLCKDPLNATLDNFWEIEILELDSRLAFVFDFACCFFYHS